jgi:glycosyltransferase involved in cell wall biosynthesis
MRIAIDARGAQNPSGIGIATESLIRSLLRIDSKHEYILIRNSDSGSEGLPGNVRRHVTRNRLTDHPVADAWFHLVLPSLLRKWSVDLFWGPGYLVPLPKGPYRVISTFHDLSFEDTPSTFPLPTRLYFRTMYRKCAARADRIIAISDFTKSEIGKHYGAACEEKTRVIPNGYDETLAGGEDSKPPDRPGTCSVPGPYILTVGNLEPRKNLPTLIEAFRILKLRMGIPHRLVVVGQKAWLSDSVFDCIRSSGMEGQIVLTGYVDRRELAALYRGAEVFAYPSKYEGFGLPVLEAMSCGVPVVAANASSIPEVAGDAALLTDPYDAAGMAEAIRDIIETPGLRKKLADGGRERCCRYSWGKSASALLSEIQACG